METRRLLNIWACAFLLVAISSGNCWAANYPKTYDHTIAAAAKRYWPGVPWKLWKAQLWQESKLDPNARSPVGAEGLAQFMPATWAEISKAMGTGVLSRRLAEPSIEAGAYYMARLRAQWSARRAEEDRHKLAQASYNAGIGHLLTAQRLCGNAAPYPEIVACLPAVTGAHAQETTTYVQRIWRWWAEMELTK